LQTFITVSSILSDILPSFIPYTLLLFSFGAFVAWNGGIVLGETPFGTSFRFIFISDCRSRSGDKSNHALTLHVPQMYYFVAFCTLLGWPVLISGRSGMSGLVREVSWRMFGSRRLALFRVFANTKQTYRQTYRDHCPCFGCHGSDSALFHVRINSLPSRHLSKH
jgi:alpha-1,2-glucosyltransferase